MPDVILTPLQWSTEEKGAKFKAFQNARALAKRGYPVFPLYGIVEGADGTVHCQCGNEKCIRPADRSKPRAGKHPHGRLAPSGKDNATVDLAILDKWRATEPGCNWAMATGPVVVLDIDGPSGDTSFTRLAMTRGEIERIKAFLSRDTDRVRLPYGRTVTEMPRQSVLVGTTNDPPYLKDETGGRRLLAADMRSYRR